ncbi:cytochrome P450 [Kutzneria buriramensis]|uniref:Fatty-acid peroxygenase n=1 Tax=Kutzneria buriramensis TaxID=1045776 RepID=A0A3E0H7A2_9PSEU|nr:cytochrome P450 [Kutzneria buriramensis]REH39313.1 fatty-acid peroxygenase [Kutzneria buriramensis]
MPVDETVSLLTEGYAWLPDRRRRTPTVRTRLLGRRAWCIGGVGAARYFYDEENVRRHGALPEPVLSTLFGRGAVHTLDGEEHRSRKEMFLSIMDPAGVADLTERVVDVWDQTLRPGRMVLFDEAGRVLTEAVCDWAGIRVAPADLPALAADLIAMVDGFATAGPRHLKARIARRRREKWLARVADGAVVDVVAKHIEDPHVRAVELLNVIRPTAALSWFVTFAAHALHRWPEHRESLAAGGDYAVAFAHEVRRFYPFVPFLAGLAARDLDWLGEEIPEGSLVLLDIHGHNHDPELWPDPYAFSPGRFLDRAIGPFELVPQGAGWADDGHRCPGEGIAVSVLAALSERLARLDYEVPHQDLTISLRRVPARPRSGFVLVVPEKPV